MDIKTFDAANLPPILQRCKDLGYKVFTDKNYDLNLIACRSPSRESGKFDDVFYEVFRLGDRYIQESYLCTTDAGLYFMHNPARVAGTAILVAGQYRGVYKLDMHRGKYLALCQRGGKVAVYRDANRDEILDHDPDSIQEGYFGINIHRASAHKSLDEVGR